MVWHRQGIGGGGCLASPLSPTPSTHRAGYWPLRRHALRGACPRHQGEWKKIDSKALWSTSDTKARCLFFLLTLSRTYIYIYNIRSSHCCDVKREIKHVIRVSRHVLIVPLESSRILRVDLSVWEGASAPMKRERRVPRRHYSSLSQHDVTLKESRFPTTKKEQRKRESAGEKAASAS